MHCYLCHPEIWASFFPDLNFRFGQRVGSVFWRQRFIFVFSFIAREKQQLNVLQILHLPSYSLADMSRNNSAVDELKTTSDSGRRGATYEVVFAKGRERLQSDASVHKC